MEFYKYQNTNEVPRPWRTFKSARLSLAQINAIMEDAHTNPVKSETELVSAEGEITKAPIEIPDFAGARRRFAESHHIENSFWVEGQEEIE